MQLWDDMIVPGFLAKGEYVNQHGLSRKHIFDAVEGSLQRLGLDYIDLYQIHRLDRVSTAASIT
jgi:aryl-alcohol dehydrogenase-like predicted oxidoreductase